MEARILRRIFTTLLIFIVSNNSIAIENIISGRCTDNENVVYVYNRTPSDVNSNFFSQTVNLKTSLNIQKPYWDIRYINPAQKYINGGTYNFPNHGIYTGLNVNTGNNNIGFGTNASRYDASGSIIQSECVNGYIAGGAMLNLFDAPLQHIEFGGIAATFAYEFTVNARPSPWTQHAGNLMIQGLFDNPWYLNIGNNPGAEVNIGLFIKNKFNNQTLHYIVSVYRTNHSFSENPNLSFDTNLNLAFVSTLIKNGTKWVTKSPYSKSAEGSRTHTVSGSSGWNDFYRVNISNTDLKELLEQTNRPQRPQDWEVAAIFLQYELANEGFASFAGSFRAFEVYKTNQPW